MSLEKYKKVFTEALSIDQSKFDDKVKYNDIPDWDPIGHMTLISELEENFSISIDTDDVVDFSSFEVGKKILSKYGVKF